MTMSPPRPVGAERAAWIRQAFADRRLVRVAGAHDGLTARLAEQAGFDAVWASSFGISAAACLPDVSLLGLAEYLSASTAMHRAVEVPVLADCDTGFGGSINAAYTMMQFESAGIAAVCIEDKVFPKRNSFVGAGQQLLAAEEFAGKLQAAAEARSRRDTLLIGRTEALICGEDIDEALRRCHLYVEAGADAILIHSKASGPGEVIEFLRRWERRAPVVVVPTTYAAWDSADAAEAGVDMVIYANQALRALVSAVRSTWSAVLEHGSSGPIEQDIAPVRDIFAISQLDTWLGRER
ncbi:isocitrate lyase/phosphoenolpyruvate mutase family protein [Pseudonocardia sp. ICBG1293]|uniref:isocitrate lyase/phosphoenolpyruvate mutase family protein n=1 Tax=Pseudonocardia sp. ICBG1293 TaxID=2844382 RepID=UPI001CCA9496|nr:isocitrate lyase/phosphoenolpyruvate mutase family protein [Pseudonocardia sp. ICBG1293]